MNKDDLKILQSEYDKTRVSRLPDRPNVGRAMGGQGLSAQELKERLDASSSLIVERFNALIEALSGVDEDGERCEGVADLMMTGLGDGYSLADLFAGLASGEAAQRVKSGIDQYSIKGFLEYLKQQLEVIGEDYKQLDVAVGKAESAAETAKQAVEEAAASVVEEAKEAAAKAAEDAIGDELAAVMRSADEAKESAEAAASMVEVARVAAAEAAEKAIEDELSAASEAAERAEKGAKDAEEAAEEAIAALQPKPYELIEEITIDEAVASFKRKLDTNGVAYNFSGIRVKVRTPAAAGANTSTQLIFNIEGTAQDYFIYHQLSGGLATTEKVSYLVANNDHGLLDYYVLTSSPNNTGSREMRDGYVIKPWRNVVSVQVLTYPATVQIPAGTTITIYGIRG